MNFSGGQAIAASALSFSLFTLGASVYMGYGAYIENGAPMLQFNNPWTWQTRLEGEINFSEKWSLHVYIFRFLFLLRNIGLEIIFNGSDEIVFLTYLKHFFEVYGTDKVFKDEARTISYL